MAGEPRGSLFYFESPGTPSEPFSLQDGNPSSPLLGAGANPSGNGVPGHDLDGNARPGPDNETDMGAYQETP